MNNGAWTEDQEIFVHENFQKMTIEDMADHICKSSLAVQLYMHRHRLAISPVNRNLIQEILKIKFVYPEYFTPNKAFYKAVNISQVRWWDIYYGRKQCTNEEYIAVATHLNVSLQEAFESRQLSIFDTLK